MANRRAEIAAEFTRTEQIEATETAGITRALPRAIRFTQSPTGIKWHSVGYRLRTMPVARARISDRRPSSARCFVTAERVKRSRAGRNRVLLGAYQHSERSPSGVRRSRKMPRRGVLSELAARLPRHLKSPAEAAASGGCVDFALDSLTQLSVR